MRIATWNVNSLNARLQRVEEWLEYAQPDVLCMQETKMSDEAFPALDYAALGYDTIHVGQGQWNGVAILSRVGVENVYTNFADGQPPDEEARLVTADCGGVTITCVYVPNGRSPDHDHFQYKLAWLDRLYDHLNEVSSPDQDVIITGDFNIAPEDIDVWDPKVLEGATHGTVEERGKLERLLDWGLIDIFRQCHDADGLFFFFFYRGGSFHKREGMRIDLVLGSKSVADATRFALIDRNARKGKLPSDHTPVLIDVDRAA